MVNFPIDDGVRGAGLGLGIVLLIILAGGGGWRDRASLLALVASALAYLLCAAPARPCCGSAWSLPFLLGAAAFPFCFWWVTSRVVEDAQTTPVAAWLGLATLAASAIPAAADWVPAEASTRTAFAWINKAAALSFMAAAIWVLWRSWEGDLIEGRRRVRWWLLAYLGLHALIVLAAEIHLQGQRAPAWLDTLNAGVISLAIGAALAALSAPSATAMEMLLGPSSTQIPPPPDTSIAANSPDGTDAQDLQRLRDLMEMQYAYRDPDLSIGSVARRLELPEYALRRLVHDGLGHRHFSAFVNQYRLDEVRAQLLAPDLARRPILTLALEAGFGSIGPFNRAFKERYGVTPSEFRKGTTKSRSKYGAPG